MARQQSFFMPLLNAGYHPCWDYGGKMIGEKLGKYIITEKIGAGSMGVVYRGEDPASGRPVVIKLVPVNILYDLEKRERFLQGLLAASEIRHRGLCPILEIGDEEDDFFVVSPLLQGETLDQAMRARSLHWTQALDVGIAAGDTLVAVHAADTAHRALKPANIWLQSDGSVILTDCCIARFTEIAGASDTRVHGPRTDSADTIIPMSALAYMSPEQIRGDAQDCRSDIFSLGVVLYEMLTERHPFEARNSLSRMSAILEADPLAPSLRKHGLPGALDGIVAKSLAKTAQNRYQTVGELLSALRMVRSDESCSASATASPRANHGFAFSRAIILITCWLLLMALGFCVYQLVLR